MKTQKSIVALFALLVLASVTIPAATASAAIKVEGDAYAGISSKYLWRGFDLSNGKAVAQGGMDLSAHGVTLSYWSNLDLRSSELNETDFTIDYSTDLNDKLALSVGNIFYALDGASDTNELYLGLSLKTLLSPTLTVYYDYDQAQETGLYYTLAISHDLEISKDFSLSLGGLISYNQKSDYAVGNYSALHNYELSLSGAYAITDQISISPSIIYSNALSDTAKNSPNPIGSEFVGGLNLTLNF
ncbi:TorF family putative porin [Geopsychrobacter electrodiphilus]|uniref:TorF family putative porin n=1 Tax=Geopsychrobacter electrodiphilus TaxID=225196 RepID=UPI0003732C98|nr:TorF family putative porin [Geopsychrobacter electrodiphilus]